MVLHQVVHDQVAIGPVQVENDLVRLSTVRVQLGLLALWFVWLVVRGRQVHQRLDQFEVLLHAFGFQFVTDSLDQERRVTVEVAYDLVSDAPLKVQNRLLQT